MKIYDSIIKPFDMTGINKGCIVAFKPKDEKLWYTGNVGDVYPPVSKYNKKDTWFFDIMVILPVHPQWCEDGDKTVYFHDEIDEIVILDNSK
jgi:hypothetical protein